MYITRGLSRPLAHFFIHTMVFPICVRKALVTGGRFAFAKVKSPICFSSPLQSLSLFSFTTRPHSSSRPLSSGKGLFQTYPKGLFQTYPFSLTSSMVNPAAWRSNYDPRSFHSTSEAPRVSSSSMSSTASSFFLLHTLTTGFPSTRFRLVTRYSALWPPIFRLFSSKKGRHSKRTHTHATYCTRL